MTIVETRAITGGVDTHADVHVADAWPAQGQLPAPAAEPGSLHVLNEAIDKDHPHNAAARVER